METVSEQFMSFHNVENNEWHNELEYFRIHHNWFVPFWNVSLEAISDVCSGTAENIIPLVY